MCNLRVTASVLDALSAVEAVSTETGYAAAPVNGTRYPALRLSRSPFTGVTTFG